MLENSENLAAVKVVEQILRDGGVKPTPQRVSVSRVLFARHQHLSADQVLAQVNAAGGILSKATVYNTLKLFVENRLVREVIVDPEKVFYDSNTTPHHHFYDVDSGEIIDIDAEPVKVSGLPPAPQGKVTEGIDVVVRVRGA